MVKPIVPLICMALLLAFAGACVNVAYQGPEPVITPREGQVLVFGRVRFFQDEVEFFPWKPAFLPESAWRGTERHIWLLRLGRRAVSAEVHPESDGALAIWIRSGDYALIGGTEIPTTSPVSFEVIALIRVPEGPVAVYAGDVIFKTEHHEGWYASRGAFGSASVEVLPVDEGRAALEQRLGVLPRPPAVSAWCVGEELPRFDDSDLMARAREILDRGCE
jgi:hypothetical protein